jgi:hypothetical protein
MKNLKIKGLFVALLLVSLWSCDKESIAPVSQTAVVEKTANSNMTSKTTLPATQVANNTLAGKTFLETQDALGGYTMFYSVYKSDDFLKNRINFRNREEASFQESMIAIGELNTYAEKCFGIVKANNPNLGINQIASGEFVYSRNIGTGFTYAYSISRWVHVSNPFTTNKVRAVIKRTQNNGVILLTIRPFK